MMFFEKQLVQLVHFFGTGAFCKPLQPYTIYNTAPVTPVNFRFKHHLKYFISVEQISLRFPVVQLVYWCN